MIDGILGPMPTSSDEGAGAPSESLRKERSDFAAFKFNLLETLAADPAKPSHACVSVIVAYGRFADHQTKEAYCSLSTLMIRADISSKETVVTNRNWLVAKGYLEKVEGRQGPNGEAIYKLNNPRMFDVKDHVTAATEKRNEDVAREKREYRKRRSLADLGSTEIRPPNIEREYGNPTAGGTEIRPNPLEDTLDISLSRVEEDYYGTDYESVKSGNEQNSPFPVPESDEEAEDLLSGIFDDAGKKNSPALRSALKFRLMEGSLTPALAQHILVGPKQEAA